MGWFDLRSLSKGKSSGGPDLEETVKPYREAIVGTTTPPGVARVELRSWEDLTRASDTLGKPILRYTPNGGPGGRTFYVLDGPTTYVFEFGSTSTNGCTPAPGGVRPNEPGPPPAAEASTAPLSASAVPTSFSTVELTSSSNSPDRGDQDELRGLRDRARGLLRRITVMPSSDPALNGALTTLGQAIALMRAGRFTDARARLDAVDKMVPPK